MLNAKEASHGQLLKYLFLICCYSCIVSFVKGKWSISSLLAWLSHVRGSFIYRADVIKSFCQNSRVTCLSRMTVQAMFSGIKQTGFWELGITRKCFLLQEDERNTTTIDVNKNNNKWISGHYTASVTNKAGSWT